MNQKIKIIILKVLKWILLSMGVLSIIFIVLAFTDLPFNAYYSLSSPNKKLDGKADVIVLMGGDGMPSPSSLMRNYHAAELYKENYNPKIIIAFPQSKIDSTHQLDLMRKNLILNGVDSTDILYAPKGYNTRTQALEIAEMIPHNQKMLIVSSGEHIYRTIKVFQKLGFNSLGSGAAFETPINEIDLKRKKKELREVQNLAFRYNFWSYMEYEIRVAREYFAITYYWFKSWI